MTLSLRLTNVKPLSGFLLRNFAQSLCPPSTLYLANGTEAVKQRITDFPEKPNQYLPPIWGYDATPLMSLEEAVRSLIPILSAIQSYVYSAKQNCINPADDLTPDQSAAIMLYTMSWEPLEGCLYHVLNTTLRSRDRQKLKPWFPYLKLFLTALARLPLISNRTIYRGVKT